MCPQSTQMHTSTQLKYSWSQSGKFAYEMIYFKLTEVSTYVLCDANQENSEY